MRRTKILCAWMCLASLAAAAADTPPPASNLILEGDFPGATLMQVRIAAGKESVEYSLPMSQGKLRSGVHSPAGSVREYQVWTEDARGERLFEGAAHLEGDIGIDTLAVIEMKSVLDGSTAELTLAGSRVSLEFSAVRRGENLLARVTAEAFDADGRRLTGLEKELDWSFEEPWIRDLLRPCKGVSGSPTLCAEFDPRQFIKNDLEFAACLHGRICAVQPAPSPAPVWQKVSVGLSSHACAIKLDGTAWCWGRGHEGQLGTAAPDLCAYGITQLGCSMLPVQVHLPVQCSGRACQLIDISAGKQHSCAIDEEHRAWCWGGNGYGEAGTGVRDALPDGRPIPVGSPVPQRVSGGHVFESIRAGAFSTCGLTQPAAGTSAREVYCWGSNGSGLVPDVAWDLNKIPMRVAAPADAAVLDHREGHACVRTLQGELWCWGTDSSSQIVSGTGYTFSPSRTCRNCPATPVRMQDSVDVLAGKSVASFSTGAHGSCANVNSADTLCWGWSLPASPRGLDAEQVSRGVRHYCTISRGDLRCAGDGVLGDGATTVGSLGAGPLRVTTPLHYRQVDAGNESSCGIGADEVLYCWGSNEFGQLGIGAGSGTTLPVPVFVLQTLRLP